MKSVAGPPVQPHIPRQFLPKAGGSPHDGSQATLLKGGGLRKAFEGLVVLDDINLDLREGEVILLRGDNGSGKTTLATS